MSIVHLFKRNDSLATTTDTTEIMIGVDLSGQLYSKDSSGVKRVYSTGITPEEVQDIIGNTLVSSPSLTLTYDDAGNTISGTVVQTAIDHTQIQNRGTNTHAQIDTFITATATALNGKENTITFGTPSQYWRGDKSWQTLDKTAVGLNLVDNTSDANKPISTATQTSLNGKEASISLGSLTQYWRGDKSWQTLDKAAVGLNLVDNTSDANKPISTATQTALNGKEASISLGSLTQYWRGDKSWQTLDKTAVGLNFVDNTADVNKPISSPTQVALNAKYDATNPSNFETPTQLNARDAANRARANHTGTQLSNTISDFATTVRSTALTGLTLDNNPIAATDTVLSGLGRTQGQINAHFDLGGNVHAIATTVANGFMSAADKVKVDGLISDVVLRQTTALTNSSNSTLVIVSDLSIPVVNGLRYMFDFNILWDSANTNTGLGISVGGTATGTLRAVAILPISNTAGTSAMFGGPINALNGIVVGSATGAVGTQYFCRVQGIFTATSNGVIYPQFRSESNGTQVRVNIDSAAVYKGF
jgi:hypothetical protein